MISPQVWTIVTGLAVAVSAITLTLWQILSAPDRPNYPTSGRVKRTIMFIVSVAFAGRATEILTSAFSANPVRMTDMQAVSALALASLFIVFLVDHMRHWLPARTWKRIQQLLAIARCRPRKDVIEARTSAMLNSTGAPCPAADVVGPALAELHMQGFIVAGPKEGPEAFTDH